MLTITAPDKINLFTINELYDKTIAKIKSSRDNIKYDLSNVKEIDTAGVAFLLDLKAYAQKIKINIEFANPPAHVYELSKLYKVTL